MQSYSYKGWLLHCECFPLYRSPKPMCPWFRDVPIVAVSPTPPTQTGPARKIFQKEICNGKDFALLGLKLISVVFLNLHPQRSSVLLHYVIIPIMSQLVRLNVCDYGNRFQTVYCQQVTQLTKINVAWYWKNELIQFLLTTCTRILNPQIIPLKARKPYSLINLPTLSSVVMFMINITSNVYNLSIVNTDTATSEHTVKWKWEKSIQFLLK